MRHSRNTIHARTRARWRRVCSAALAFTLVFTLGVPLPAFAETAAEKQAEAEEALARLNAMQETLDRLSAEYGEALMAQQAAEEAVEAAKARIEELNVEIASTQEQLGDRAREMYRNGSTSYLDTLLGAASFEEFATNWDLLNRFNEADADLVDRTRELRAEVQEQEAELEVQAAAAAQHAEEAAQAEAEAQATVAEMQATYDALSEEAARLLEEERKAQEEAERARMQAVIEAAAAAAAAQNAAQNGSDVANGGTSYDFSNDTMISEQTAYEGGNDTVSRAYACLGAPYVWGAVGPYGYDCSGLVSYCLSGQHIRLGTTYTFMGWTQVSDPQPGDIAVNWGHTGVYIGGGQMIHAADYGIGVIIGPVQSGMIIVRYGA